MSGSGGPSGNWPSRNATWKPEAVPCSIGAPNADQKSEGQALLERLRAAATQLARTDDSLGEALAQLLGGDAVGPRPGERAKAESYQGFLPALAALAAEFEHLASDLTADVAALRARF